MTPMTAERQRQIVEFLRPVATDRENIEDADAARSLLRKIHSRGDVTLEAASAIDAILASPTHEQPQPGSQPGPRPMWEAPQPPPAPPGHNRWRGGVFLLLIATTVFCGGIIGIVVGLLNRNDPAKGNQAKALLWIGVAVLALGIIVAIASAIAEQSTCDPTFEVC